ncbi:hypothetical protein B0T22DRAFT_433896 [Podospora appendiculata]|uniref:Zn(2)-C6 fungal-type domain-containing protein n=1 Tax=Podospora appendiculata TaxID=314037 RepID=A0AAE1C7K5_9PEZI|nr:hypothetical protein B0T22DRAFT_433896 [Podospora appendiculata]
MDGRGLRQQPGFACEECRRRKARCDRGRPKCGFCTETGTTCVIVDKRQQRGPKKGQLNAMRSQIATLQWQLDQHFDAESGSSQQQQQQQHQLQQQHQRQQQQHEADMQLGFNVGPTTLTVTTSSATTTPTTITYASTAPTTNSTTRRSTISPTTASSNCAGGSSDLTSWQDLMPLEWARSEDLSDMDLDLAETSFMHSRMPSISMDHGHGHGLGLDLTEHMRADLDQLYFDRVHPVCPIVHRRRYFAWAGGHETPSPSPARTCLQSAMRTMAAAMSVHMCHLVDDLRAETRQLLDTHCQIRASSQDEIPLEHTQAWLLLAYAELLRIGEHQAMLTAGRAFRLVQMARLYEIDRDREVDQQPSTCRSPRTTTTTTHHELDETFADTEERRRTFWLAFSLDHFLCLRSEWPLTLHEDMASPSESRPVRTRLPAPESNFQNNQPIRIPFLPDAISSPPTTTSPSHLSPFAECVVLAALYGRCMTHRRAFANSLEPATSDLPHQPPKLAGVEYPFWMRQDWLASAIEKRVQILVVPGGPVDSDPMLLFAHMLAHSAVVFLSNTITLPERSTTNPDRRWGQRTMEQQLVAAAYERRATVAAFEIVRLARAVPSLSCFKAHPFLPDPLTAAVNFLSSRSALPGPGGDGGGGGGGAVCVGSSDGVEQMLGVLRDVQVINSLAREHFLALQGVRYG